VTVRTRIEELEDSPIVDVWRMGFTVPDVIGLWAGEGDLSTPAFICDAAAAALAAGQTFYTANRGIPELRAALADYMQMLWGVRVADDRIAVTSSGMNAVMLAAQALVEPGDNVVMVAPSWPNIARAVEIMGGEVRMAPLSAGNEGWRLDLDALFARCDGRTKAIYYASPGNPTGWLLELAQAERLLAFARDRGIALLADEVYHRIIYDRPVAPSLLEIARPEDQVYVLNSFSKAWAMTGWRLGWFVYPAGQTANVEKLVQFNTSGGPGFLQAGAVAALRQGEAFVQSFVARCRAGRDLTEGRLAGMPRVRLTPSRAAFYTMFSVEGMRDTLGFCKRAVIEARVGLAPGMAFGGGADGQIRLCYARSLESLAIAMDRLEGFIAGYRE
jgi:aspartate/methionine/tyrosine aminotransferase